MISAEDFLKSNSILLPNPGSRKLPLSPKTRPEEPMVRLAMPRWKLVPTTERIPLSGLRLNTGPWRNRICRLLPYLCPTPGWRTLICIHVAGWGPMLVIQLQAAPMTRLGAAGPGPSAGAGAGIRYVSPRPVDLVLVG